VIRRLAIATVPGVVLAASCATIAASLGAPPLGVLAAGLVGVPAVLLALHATFKPFDETLRALADGVRSFHENDFSLRLAEVRDDELGDLVRLYNEVADALRVSRNEVFQRELLLDTLLQGAPMAILLLNELGRVVYANRAARLLLGKGTRLQGRSYEEVLEANPADVRRALAAGEDGIFSIGEEIYRVVLREFLLSTQRHRLVEIERITPELKRQEVETWKRVIRVMSHELNNSLAPVSSLLHSARAASGKPEHAHRVGEILSAAEERVRHLAGFLEGYAQFARLPKPRKEEVPWSELLDAVNAVYPFRLEGPVPAQPGRFDRAQLQQVLINLLKNAAESGSPPEEIAVRLEELPQRVGDRKQRHLRRERQARASRHAHVGRLARRGLDQSTLPDAGLADDQQQATAQLEMTT
jgi:nitrogen fixation/metabolism regulation signal transduction histidine kinase